jgi:hypothetical protein
MNICAGSGGIEAGGRAADEQGLSWPFMFNRRSASAEQTTAAGAF